MVIRTSIFMSLDNRIDANSDWQYPWFDEEFFSVLSGEWHRADALLVGARSFSGYEELAEQHAESPMVALLNSKPVIVASRTRSTSKIYKHAIFVADLLPATIAGVENKQGNVLVLGSPTSLITMAENGALTTLNLIVIPTVVGVGPALFDTSTPGFSFRTEEARKLSNGVVLLDLVVDRDAVMR